MQWPYILNGKVWPSSILFGDDKASLKTSVESVEPSFDNPPVIHQDEFPTLAKKNEQIFCYKGKSLSEALLFCKTSEEHVVYRNCSECQKQFLFTTCSPQVWA